MQMTTDNYHKFLTYHGLDPEVAMRVVATYLKTEKYKTDKTIRQWVDASMMVLRGNNLEC
jgi:hypothetical protein